MADPYRPRSYARCLSTPLPLPAPQNAREATQPDLAAGEHQIAAPMGRRLTLQPWARLCKNAKQPGPGADISTINARPPFAKLRLLHTAPKIPK
jgi:hypothetical protein